MKQAKNQFGNLLLIVVLLLTLLALASFLAACGSEESPGDSGEAIAEAVLEPTAAPATPTDESTSTTETVAEVVDPAGPDACMDCHSDKDMLIDTADPVEEVVSENEGEG
ncbi:MAG: hypothetical protein ACK2UR_08295 [Candidatus Promineifilaceae bacterium]